MKNLIIVLFAALSFYSCTDLSDTNTVDCGNVTNVAYQSFSYCGVLKENPKQPSFIIVNSNEEMQKLFTSCQTFDVALPDFTQKRILGLLAGPKPTGGYTIKIQSVVEDNCQIIVEYFEKEPKKEDIVAQVITYPADYIVLPKSNKPIFFKKAYEINDYVVMGTYFGECIGTDCQQFFKMDNEKVLHYLNVNYNSYDFNPYSYKALGFKDDFAAFLLKIPTEIKALKGQTKTFGAPDSHDQGGVYFEWSQAGTVTKIYLDTDNSTDQTQNIMLFKKVIQDKITELKTKS
ncbi:protease complex subunit PrcB family protein [Flavobacterium taihuense]|uniref:Protease complex subunit PrcB family protein n=1 Tax=Flavobacterium taihuense TaxID=2857508 RepID=A0ABS6XX73_9FLAO|nr:protease complex subunit PrcB family protein [Flavobacterium taihuense]MBW4361274.1 protease complex subunit PrcB family protein [Flavobacterium taihuense]